MKKRAASDGFTCSPPVHQTHRARQQQRGYSDLILPACFVLLFPELCLLRVLDTLLQILESGVGAQEFQTIIFLSFLAHHFLVRLRLKLKKVPGPDAGTKQSAGPVGPDDTFAHPHDAGLCGLMRGDKPAKESDFQQSLARQWEAAAYRLANQDCIG